MTATPEMRFIVRCLPAAPGIKPEAAEPESVLDFGKLIDLAKWNGVFPMVALRLLSKGQQQSTQPLPASILAAWKESQSDHLRRSLIQTLALIELQRGFQAAGIRIVPWKGPSVGLLLYGSANLRDSGDLDFLFREQDLPLVQTITTKLGYSGYGATDEKERYEFAHQHEFSFYRSRDQVLLEFHAQIMTSRFSAWQDTQTYVANANVRFPLADTELILQSPEDLLIGLCVHAVKHNWERLKWSCDVAMFLRRYGSELNWTAYIAGLARTGRHSIVLLGVALAGKLFALQLPPAVEEALDRSPALLSLADRLSSHLMAGAMQSPLPKDASQMIALLCPSAWDRLVYIFSPIVRLEYEDLYIRDEKSPFFFLNYPYRFWRLLRHHGLPRLVSMTAVYIRSIR